MNRLFLLPLLFVVACTNDTTEVGTDFTSQARATVEQGQAENPPKVTSRLSFNDPFKMTPAHMDTMSRAGHRAQKAMDQVTWQDADVRLRAFFSGLPEAQTTPYIRASAAAIMLTRHFATLETPEQANAAMVYVEQIAAFPGIKAGIANRTLLAAEPHISPDRFRDLAGRLVASSDAWDAAKAARTDNTPGRPLNAEEQREEEQRVQTLRVLRARANG